MIQCQFCKSLFSTKKVLSYHQKTAKYCLAIQGKEILEYKCKFCSKIFTRKDGLQVHKNVCKKSLEVAQKKVDELSINSTHEQSYLDKARELAKQRNGKCISEKYINIKTNLTWQCEFGHIWEASYNSIRKTWCRFCNGNLKKTIDDCQLMAKKYGGVCLSEIYEGSKKYMDWQCSEGHTWSAKYNTIQQGRWCPECVGVAKNTLENAQKLANSREGACLSEVYKNAYEMMIWKCSQGHIWSAKYNSIQQGSWCAVCSKKKKHTLEEACKLAASRGGICLSETYRNNSSYMDWQCSEGHIWQATFRSIQNDQWCLKCSLYNNEQKTREIFEKLLGVPFYKKKGLFSNSRLELDGYSDCCGIARNIKIGFEYQGRQHYEYIPYFHRNGPDDLDEQQERDQQKRIECQQLGIHLIEVPHFIKDKETYIKNQLANVLNSIENYHEDIVQIKSKLNVTKKLTESGLVVTMMKRSANGI